MNLRERAERDLGRILENRVTGFGWPIQLTNPQGITYPEFTGQSMDIALTIDPETGALVTGRTASIAIRLSALYAAGIEKTDLPRAMSKPTDTPWVAKVNDINGYPCTFKVVESRPDRALGLLVCILEGYKP